jgi:hypothetical protein
LSSAPITEGCPAAWRGRFALIEVDLASELDAEAATRLLVNRLRHAPSKVLQGLAAS